MKKFKYLDLEKNHFLAKHQQYLDALPEEGKTKKRKICVSFKVTSSDFTFDPTSTHKLVKFDYSKMKSGFLLEFLVSERKYVENLNIFHDIYYQPIRSFINSEIELISIEDINIILPKELYNIIEFSRGLLMSLLERISILEHYVQHNNTSISDIFIIRRKFLENHYVPYIHFHQISTQNLSDLEKKNPEFIKYLNQRKKILYCGGKSIQNFLSLPLQRLQKYFNLLQNLLNITSNTDPDFESLNSSVLMMSELITQQKMEIEKIDSDFKIGELERLSGLVKKRKITFRQLKDLEER
jgi:hypothetical protein